MITVPASMSVTVVFSPGPRGGREWPLTVPAGAAIFQALLQAEGLPGALAAAGLPTDFSGCHIGVWGKLAVLQQVLCEHDRIEIYRALTVDPKVARRERFKKQGRRTAGLFTHKKTESGSPMT